MITFESQVGISLESMDEVDVTYSSSVADAVVVSDVVIIVEAVVVTLCRGGGGGGSGSSGGTVVTLTLLLPASVINSFPAPPAPPSFRPLRSADAFLSTLPVPLPTPPPRDASAVSMTPMEETPSAAATFLSTK